MDDRIPLEAVPGLRELRAETRGDPRICIAVLDGPVDLSHPCFTGARLELVETLVSGDAGDDVASHHGTHVASVIFGQPGSVVEGIAPDCRGLIVPIYSPRGRGLSCSQLDLARAINQAVVLGANIINISGGELAPGGEAEPLLAEAILRCTAGGVLIVAAAGNDGCACLHVPAAVPTVLAVGAMGASGSALEFSNWGTAYDEQGVLALGELLPGAVPGGGVAYKTGTSFATAVVSGIAGLLMSAQLARGETPDGEEVRAAILQSADSCDPLTATDCRRLLAGRLSATAAHARLSSRQVIPASLGAGSAVDPAHGHYQRTEKETHMSDEIEAIDAHPSVVAAEFPAQSDAPAVMPSEVRPACATGCANDAQPAALAYVLGQIGYDFGTESRRDQFLQLTNRNVHDPEQLLAYLQKDPASAASVIWTLSLDSTVVYAIAPFGPFAFVAYERLREALAAQLSEGAERVSVPGVVKGTARLLNGQVVPTLFPDVRGVYSWTTAALVSATVGKPAKGEKAGEQSAKAQGVQNFLERIYYEIRNLGITPQERAMNYAATNAFQLDFIYQEAVSSGLKLDIIDVERSPICRPGSDCWDVRLVFFDPLKRMERARHIYRFTIDVSDVIPVTVGKVRQWDVY